MQNKKSPAHLPAYVRDDLMTKKLMRKRKWRIRGGKYVCGQNMTSGTRNAITRRFVTCERCKKRYDAWWQSQVEHEDFNERLRMLHLTNTNMDPAQEVER